MGRRSLHIQIHKPKKTSASVDRYFEVSLLLMLGTGFVTLASTGKLDLVSVALLGRALAV